MTDNAIERRRIAVHGIVQGVGFRPFVYTQARCHHATGFVGNDTSGVFIEIQGEPRHLDNFLAALRDNPPPLSRITRLTVQPIAAVPDEPGFHIVDSHDDGAHQTLISPDTTVCDDCLRELFDPADRRYRYPFINCTNCGPRFTITRRVPYDRAHTTMDTFTLCPPCRAEYENPADRRFHAQPNACPTCGPHLSYRHGNTVEVSDPIGRAASAVAAGQIIGVKGIGGYHLCCDAANDQAVRQLRRRKHREAKPFAILVPTLAAAAQLCNVNDSEAALLESIQRPIVLLTKNPDTDAAEAVSAAVAPGIDTLGIMLPYTPVHHLLLDRFRAQPGTAATAALVMTSANPSDDPIVYRDEDAAAELATTADGLLVHNRPINMRCDDSVVRATRGEHQLLRRARGYAPSPILLVDSAAEPVLACGAHLKNTFCLLKENQAFISHHIGNLTSTATAASFEATIEHYERIFGVTPTIVAHDLHPHYRSTRYALTRSAHDRVPVQHHEAHIASVMAEHHLTEPIIGVAFDGTGYGHDGTIWGGEILVGDLRRFERFAYLDPVAMAGAEQAVRQPWRMGAAYLARAFGNRFLERDIPLARTLDPAKWHVLDRMIATGLNCPMTSSMGRLFDAVAAILGVRYDAHLEGQAAMELEALAATAGTAYAAADDDPYPCRVDRQGGPIDTNPLIQALTADIECGTPHATVAWRFHATVAAMVTLACLRTRRATGIRRVALSGGVFQNRLLVDMTLHRLGLDGFTTYINHQVPPNDGGISLGQAVIAAARTR